jgi:hypothetical protein
VSWQVGYQVFEDTDYSGVLRYVVRHSLTFSHHATSLQQDSAIVTFDYCTRCGCPTGVEGSCVETPPAGRKAGPTKVRYDWLAWVRLHLCVALRTPGF